MAETSSTSGGLDSLLDPHGTLKQAMDKAADTWCAEQTYFVTNGRVLKEQCAFLDFHERSEAGSPNLSDPSCTQ